jgi:1,4-dihydroxy-2-naphthoyl-CoA hydrolase
LASKAGEDFASELNAVQDGWNAAMGLRFVRASEDEVIVEWDVASQHLQPYGIVHGGVHAGVIEAVASVGAAIYAKQAMVGLENHTSFLHAVRVGVLRATARPLSRGRRTQVWEGTVTDATGRIVATGRVRLLCLEPETTLAGAKVDKASRLG